MNIRFVGLVALAWGLGGCPAPSPPVVSPGDVALSETLARDWEIRGIPGFQTGAGPYTEGTVPMVLRLTEVGAGQGGFTGRVTWFENDTGRTSMATGHVNQGRLTVEVWEGSYDPSSLLWAWSGERKGPDRWEGQFTKVPGVYARGPLPAFVMTWAVPQAEPASTPTVDPIATGVVGATAPGSPKP